MATLVTVTLAVPDEYADPDHPTGLTEYGVMELYQMIDWDIERGPKFAGVD